MIEYLAHRTLLTTIPQHMPSITNVLFLEPPQAAKRILQRLLTLIMHILVHPLLSLIGGRNYRHHPLQKICMEHTPLS
jgi:hypothetical protein